MSRMGGAISESSYGGESLGGEDDEHMEEYDNKRHMIKNNQAPRNMEEYDNKQAPRTMHIDKEHHKLPDKNNVASALHDRVKDGGDGHRPDAQWKESAARLRVDPAMSLLKTVDGPRPPPRGAERTPYGPAKPLPNPPPASVILKGVLQIAKGRQKEKTPGENAAKPAAGSKTWVCALCCMDNRLSDKRCLACGMARPVQAG